MNKYQVTVNFEGYVTYDLLAENKDEAKNIAKELIKKKLVACANMFPIESIYEWKEELREDLFWDVVVVNVYSTIVVAFGVSFLIAVLGMAGSFIPGEFGAIWTAISRTSSISRKPDSTLSSRFWPSTYAIAASL